MKQVSKLACVLIGFALYSSAHADDAINALKQMNTEGCTKAAKFEPDPPKGEAQTKSYCTCVYDVYYGGFSPKERANITSVPTKKEGEDLMKRLEAAQAQCRKKIGF